MIGSDHGTQQRLEHEMPGLVAFLPGLNGNENTWGKVPDYVRSSPLGADFVVDTLQYSTKITSPSDLETSAQQIITRIQTDYAQSDPIFLIGYSLGGLVAREICRSLLEKGPDNLLNKIPAILTLGTPLEGARIGNIFLRCNPFFSPKIAQLARPELAFANYRRAMHAASSRTVGRPKLLHIRMEDDGVIASHIRDNFTEDDRDAGVIPGTHTNFATNSTDAEYVANVLLTQIRISQNALSRPHIVASPVGATETLPDRLILIACSHGKRDGGAAWQPPEPVSWISEPNLRQRVISKRSFVYGILKDAKLEDGFERGGNRAHQPANRNLKYGPDFGGVSVTGETGYYTPSWQRYNGRLYGPISTAGWDNYFANRHRLRILIMSGLYGLLEPDEWIQNYDVHLTDTHADSGQSVSSTWAELYTECIENYIRQAYHNRKVKIFDLLCDHHYIDAIQWHKLSPNCSVYHLASPSKEDVGLLPPAGTLLNALLLDPDKLEGFEREDKGTKYAISEFGEPPQGMSDMSFIFESRVGISKSKND